MKTSHILITLALVVLVGFFVWSKEDTKDTAVVVNTPSVPQTENIRGCYSLTNGKDLYTLTIQSQNGKQFAGTLAFKNFEKDSSSGTYNGTYDNGILLGDYAFRSEGMDSVMQVVFKKEGDTFVRGYGDLTSDGTHFTDLSKITYDSSLPLTVFKKGACTVPSQ